MGNFKEQIIEYQPHNFNDTTVTLKGMTSGDIHVCEALNSLEVDETNVKVEISDVASGAAIENIDPRSSGTFKMTFMESSSTTDWIVAHKGERIQITVADSNAPNLDANGRGFIEKHATVKRGKMVDVPEWTLVTPYINIRGGSYRLVEA